MQMSRLFTYSFDPNVGPYDRVFRIISGLALAIFPFVTSMAVPMWLAIVLTIEQMFTLSATFCYIYLYKLIKSDEYGFKADLTYGNSFRYTSQLICLVFNINY